MQILIALAGLGLKLLGFFSRSKAERLGEMMAHRKQEQDARDAENRMDQVGPATPDDTKRKLRDGKF